MATMEEERAKVSRGIKGIGTPTQVAQADMNNRVVSGVRAIAANAPGADFISDAAGQVKQAYTDGGIPRAAGQAVGSAIAAVPAAILDLGERGIAPVQQGLVNGVRGGWRVLGEIGAGMTGQRDASTGMRSVVAEPSENRGTLVGSTKPSHTIANNPTPNQYIQTEDGSIMANPAYMDRLKIDNPAVFNKLMYTGSRQPGMFGRADSEIPESGAAPGRAVQPRGIRQTVAQSSTPEVTSEIPPNPNEGVITLPKFDIVAWNKQQEDSYPTSPSGKSYFRGEEDIYIPNPDPTRRPGEIYQERIKSGKRRQIWVNKETGAEYGSMDEADRNRPLQGIKTIAEAAKDAAAAGLYGAQAVELPKENVSQAELRSAQSALYSAEADAVKSGRTRSGGTGMRNKQIVDVQTGVDQFGEPVTNKAVLNEDGTTQLLRDDRSAAQQIKSVVRALEPKKQKAFEKWFDANPDMDLFTKLEVLRSGKY